MLHEVVGAGNVVHIFHVVHFLRALLRVRVLFDWEIRIQREQVSVPGRSFSLLRASCGSVRLVVKLSCSSLISGIWVFILVNHCREGLQVRSVVPGVDNLMVVSCVVSKNKPASKCCEARVELKHSLSLVVRWQVREVVNPSLIWHYRHTTLVNSHSATEHDSNRPSNSSSQEEVW